MNNIERMYRAIQTMKACGVLLIEPSLVVMSAIFMTIGLVQLHSAGSSWETLPSIITSMTLVAIVEILNIFSAVSFRRGHGWGKVLPFIGMCACCAISISAGELFWTRLSEGSVAWVHYSFTAFAAICPLALIYIESTKTALEGAIIELATDTLEVGATEAPPAPLGAMVQQTNVQIVLSEITPVVREIVTQVIEERNLLVSPAVEDNKTYIPERKEGPVPPVVTQAHASHATRGSSVRTQVDQLVREQGEAYVRRNAEQIGQQLGCSYKTVIRHADKVCA